MDDNLEDAVHGDSEFLGWYMQDDELLSTDEVLKLHLTEETNIICPKFAVD